MTEAEDYRPKVILEEKEDDPLDGLAQQLQLQNHMYALPEEEWGALRAMLRRRLAAAMLGCGSTICIDMSGSAVSAPQRTGWNPHNPKIFNAVCHALYNRIQKHFCDLTDEADWQNVVGRIMDRENVVDPQVCASIASACHDCLQMMQGVLIEPIDKRIAAALQVDSLHSSPSVQRLALRELASQCLAARQEGVQNGSNTHQNMTVSDFDSAAARDAGVSETALQKVVFHFLSGADEREEDRDTVLYEEAEVTPVIPSSTNPLISDDSAPASAD